jgi:hypothetical protein
MLFNLGLNSDYDAGTSGIIALADAIPDMVAILSVNILKNGIGVEQARALVIILKEHPTLKSLCGNRGNETELDMSGKMNGAGDAVMLAAEVIDNGALTSLDISNNQLVGGNRRKQKEKPSWWDESEHGGVFGSSDDHYHIIPDIDGIIDIINAIKDMGALTKLDISGNAIGAEQEGDLQRICSAGGIELDK